MIVAASPVNPRSATRGDPELAYGQTRGNVVSVSGRSPPILDVSWGRMSVGGLGTGKDFKLYPGGGRPWDWRETGTEHVPGVQPADVTELLDHGASVIVVGRGMRTRLQVQRETLDLLEAKGIRIHFEETLAAVELYNRLAETEPVGGLFHSTC